MGPKPKRYQQQRCLHFITFSCYRRQRFLDSVAARETFERELERVRCWYGCYIIGYVVMPEHVHLLISEPQRGNPSRVMKALKQGFARRLLLRLRQATDSKQMALWQAPLERGRIWQRRFYDFVVFSEHKRVEKLRYMHRNPVKRGLVTEPQHWAWSSFRHYAYGEPGLAVVNELQRAELRIRKVS